jgi:hypothetical protein
MQPAAAGFLHSRAMNEREAIKVMIEFRDGRPPPKCSIADLPVVCYFLT